MRLYRLGEGNESRMKKNYAARGRCVKRMMRERWFTG